MERLKKERNEMGKKFTKSTTDQNKRLQESIDIITKHEETMSSLKLKLQNLSEKNARLVEHISTAKNDHTGALNEYMKETDLQIAKMKAVHIETIQSKESVIQQLNNALEGKENSQKNILEQMKNEHAKEVQLLKEELEKAKNSFNTAKIANESQHKEDLLAQARALDQVKDEYKALEQKLDNSVKRRAKLIEHIEKLKTEHEDRVEEHEIIIERRTSENELLKQDIAVHHARSNVLKNDLFKVKTHHKEKYISSKEIIVKLREEIDEINSYYRTTIDALHSVLKEHNIADADRILEGASKNAELENNIYDRFTHLSMELFEEKDLEEESTYSTKSQRESTESRKSEGAGGVERLPQFENVIDFKSDHYSTAASSGASFDNQEIIPDGPATDD